MTICTHDITYRLAYRAGRLLGLGFPWFKKDIALHLESARVICELRAKLRDKGQSFEGGEISSCIKEVSQ